MATFQSTPAEVLPAQTAAAGCPLEVVVVHSTTKATLHALRTAAELATGLHARIRLVVPQIVPYPRPLSSPTVSAAFNERRLRTIASGVPIETRIEVCLCRDRWQLMESALRPHSLVVLSGRLRWWPTAEQRAARRLQRLGHQVVFSSFE